MEVDPDDNDFIDRSGGCTFSIRFPDGTQRSISIDCPARRNPETPSSTEPTGIGHEHVNDDGHDERELVDAVVDDGDAGRGGQSGVECTRNVWRWIT